MLLLVSASMPGQETLIDLSRPSVRQSAGAQQPSANFAEIEGMVVRRIEFSGNERTRDGMVRRTFGLEEGHAFRYGQLRRGLGRLKRSGLFEKVAESDVRWEMVEGGKQVDVVVKVREVGSQRRR